MKKYVLDVDRFENKLYTKSKYDTSPRHYGKIEIDEKDRANFITEQVQRFACTLIESLKCVNILSFEEFKALYGEDEEGNAICPECGSIIHEEDWDKDGRRCWFCGFMGDEEDY